MIHECENPLALQWIRAQHDTPSAFEALNSTSGFYPLGDRLEDALQDALENIEDQE